MLCEDTIAAIATPAGSGAIAVIRISGPEAWHLAGRILRSASGLGVRLRANMARRCVLIDPVGEQHIDEVVAVAYRSPRSYTGEDVIEICAHGGAVTPALVLRTALAHGARAAEPGEFTMRAFLNGKLGLAEADAIADQVSARTEAAQRVAVRQREGALTAAVESLRDELIDVRAHLEACIDFPDEISPLGADRVGERLGPAIHSIGGLVSQFRSGRLYRDGLRVVISGAPNVGKSSLFNVLLGSDRAIVTAEPGTTRDTIEAEVTWSGVPVVLVDTAGIRESADEGESQGVARARAAVACADVVVHMALQPTSSPSPGQPPTVWCLGKADLLSPLDRQCPPTGWIATSAATRTGIDALQAAVLDRAAGGMLLPEDQIICSNERHAAALTNAQTALSRAMRGAREALPAEVIASDLAAAIAALDEITGRSGADDVLQTLFARFCVGK